MATLVRIARDSSAAVFRVNDSYVRVEVETRKTESADSIATLVAGGGWRMPMAADSAVTIALSEIADAAGISLDVTEDAIAASGDATSKRRVYRVPNAVREEVGRALKWRGVESGDGDALSIARTLKDAQSVDIDVITKIAKSRPRFGESVRELGWIPATEGYPRAERVTWGLWGGDPGQRWARRVLSQHRALTAAASNGLDFDPNAVYFGVGEDPDSTDCNRLLQLADDGQTWSEWEDGNWEAADAPDTNGLVIQLDQEAASYLSTQLDKFPSEYVELSEMNPIEAQLANLALGEMDLDLLSRLSAIIADAAGDGIYSPAERADNASRQGRAGGGKFAPGGGDSNQPHEKSVTTSDPKARLAMPLPLVADPGQLIDNFLQGSDAPSAADPNQPPPIMSAGMPGDPTAPTPDPVAPTPDAPAPTPDDPTSPPPDPTDATPLYLAIVDSADTSAVLDVIAIVPPEPTCWRRANGAWIAAPEILASLQSVSPPPVVELSDPDTLNTVLQQVDTHDAQDPSKGDGSDDGDASDAMAASAYELAADTAKGRERAAKKGFALPDGSFPITTVSDLKNAIRAIGRAKSPGAAKAHIKKRARALGRSDLIPPDWKSATSIDETTVRMSPLYGPFGEVATIVAVAGREVTPDDAKNTERLMHYWADKGQEGAAKIGWGTHPDDFNTCVSFLGKYVGPSVVKGLCANLHHRALGVWPGQEDGGKGGHGHGGI